MQIDPRHLEQLSVIVDVGTLQGAAKQLRTSQPALSRMIGNLETRIGMQLFERARRPLRPTAMGMELANQGRAIRTARSRAVEFIDLSARGISGILKIGAPPFLCEKLVSDAIARFVLERPAVRIELVPDYHAGLQERILQNQIDIIVGPARFVDPGNSDLTLEPLFDDCNVIVGRSGHPLLQGDTLSVQDLENVTWISHSDRSMLRHDMEAALRHLGIRNLQLAFQSESAGAVIELLRNTDFLTILPRYAVSADGRDGLSVASIDLHNPEQIISMIVLANRDETKLMADFKAHLRSYVETRYVP